MAAIGRLQWLSSRSSGAEDLLPARRREGQSGGPDSGPSIASRIIGTGGEP